MKVSSESFHQPEVPALVHVPSDAPSPDVTKRVTEHSATIKNRQQIVLTQVPPTQPPPRKAPHPKEKRPSKKRVQWYDIEPDQKAGFEPTDALPGSAEKIEVIQMRLKKGLPLWHPQDRRGYD